MEVPKPPPQPESAVKIVEKPPPKTYQALSSRFLTTPYPEFWNARTEFQHVLTSSPLLKRAALLTSLEEEQKKLEGEGVEFNADQNRQVKAMYELCIQGIRRPLIPKEKRNPAVQKMLDHPVFNDNLLALRLRWTAHLVRYEDEINSLATLGLNPDHMLKAWEKSGYVLKENLDAIKTLEATRPGSTAYLSSEFGIRDFARYPTSLLTEQFDEAENTSLPYGIIVNPYFDNYTSTQGHMRAFYEDKVAFEALQNSLQRRYLVRVAEIEGLFGLGRAINTFRRKYGTTNRISFAVLGAHGSWNGMQLAEPHAGKKHQSIDLNRLDDTPQDLGVKKAFVPNPTIILNSCEVGRDKAFAQVLSSKLDATVIAPDGKAESLESIEPHHVASGNVSFSVRFSHSDTVEFKNGEKVTSPD